jgi:hypothetical protein
LGKSVEEYERLVPLTAGRLFFGDIYAKSLYTWGKIAEKRGNRTEAGQQYRESLELWKNADPGLPEVKDARKRLAGLKRT